MLWHVSNKFLNQFNSRAEYLPRVNLQSICKKSRSKQYMYSTSSPKHFFKDTINRLLDLTLNDYYS